MINIGIIGLGYWGPNYLRIFSQLDGCHLGAASDKDSKRLAAFSKNYPSVRFFSDYGKMLENEILDAVVIATPTTTHFSIAKEVLEEGSHVLLEKPLAMTKRECAALCSTARQHKKILMVGHTFLYNSCVDWIRHFVRQGHAGKVYYLHAQRTNLGPIRHDVGALVDLAPHDISMFLHILGKDPASVSARGSAFLHHKREDVAYLHLEFKDGTMAHVHVSWLEPRKVRQLTVIGDKKMIVFDDVNLSEPVRIFDKGVTKSKEYRTFGEFQMILRDGDIVVPKIKLTEPLREQCKAFLSAVNSGKPPASDGIFGLKVVRVLEAAMKSLKSGGKAVRV